MLVSLLISRKKILEFNGISVCYIVMEPFAGTLGAFLVSMLYLQSAKLVGLGVMVAGYPILNVAVGIHISAWILQFIGHGVFEGILFSHL